MSNLSTHQDALLVRVREAGAEGYTVGGHQKVTAKSLAARDLIVYDTSTPVAKAWLPEHAPPSQPRPANLWMAARLQLTQPTMERFVAVANDARMPEGITANLLLERALSSVVAELEGLTPPKLTEPPRVPDYFAHYFDDKDRT